jgi:hypothetical protein
LRSSVTFEFLDLADMLGCSFFSRGALTKASFRLGCAEL